MIIGMVPMALGLGEGGEQNAPLGRAVIGGLVMATVATLFFVPVVFSVLHRTVPAPEKRESDQLCASTGYHPGSSHCLRTFYEHESNLNKAVQPNQTEPAKHQQPSTRVPERQRRGFPSMPPSGPVAATSANIFDQTLAPRRSHHRVDFHRGARCSVSCRVGINVGRPWRT